MGCSSKGCTNHGQALEYIKKTKPKHLILTGSCCNVRGLLGAAPRVTVLEPDVNKLAGLADGNEGDRIRLLATTTPAAALSSDPADMVYLCENPHEISDTLLSELAKVLRPQGVLLFSARFFTGKLPSGYPEIDEPDPGTGLCEWELRLAQAGLGLSIVDEKVLISSFDSTGGLEFSVSDGLLVAHKGGK